MYDILSNKPFSNMLNNSHPVALDVSNSAILEFTYVTSIKIDAKYGSITAFLPTFTGFTNHTVSIEI